MKVPVKVSLLSGSGVVNDKQKMIKVTVSTVWGVPLTDVDVKVTSITQVGSNAALKLSNPSFAKTSVRCVSLLVCFHCSCFFVPF